MANLGDQLLSPEEGWKRYDDTHPAIKYDSNWDTSPVSEAYNGTSMGALKNTQATVKFKFYGTKLRLILGSASTEFYSDKIQILIDNLPVEYFNANSAKNTEQVLQYEKIGLLKQQHAVEIKVINSQPAAVKYDYRLDAIDIDSDGKLIHPDEVSTSFILEGGQYKKYVSSSEDDMIKDESYSGEGILLRSSLVKQARKVEVR